MAFPIPFSALTSAIQQTELDSALAPWLHHHHGKDGDDKSSLASLLTGDGEDEPSSIAMAVLEELVEEARLAAGLPKSDDFEAFPFTIFAPTNRAFAQIPWVSCLITRYRGALAELSSLASDSRSGHSCSLLSESNT